MSYPEYFQTQQHDFMFNLPAGSVYDFDSFDLNLDEEERDSTAVRKRRDDTRDVINTLYVLTSIHRSTEPNLSPVSERKNKNEILSLTNVRLVKEKHLNGVKYSHDIQLVQGIHMDVKNDEFVMVLRCDGRIVAISDEAEYHLGKSMRSLYVQCINIYECLDDTDGDKLRLILNSSNDSCNREHQLICVLRLPKGKRPSRKSEDIETITMSGHFYSCHDSQHDRLFIARCETLISDTTSTTNSSKTSLINNSIIQFTLNNDMSVSMVSPNVKDILGHSRYDLIGTWFGRLLATDDVIKLEMIRHKLSQKAMVIRDTFDMYTCNGENRLTFLYQIRPVRERRSKTIKYSIRAQLIDPLLRNAENEFGQIINKVKQIDLMSSVNRKSGEESISIHSPTLEMGLFFPDTINNHYEFCSQQDLSPLSRPLSKAVAPFMFDTQSLELFDVEHEQCLKNSIDKYWQDSIVDDTYTKYQLEEELAMIYRFESDV